MRTIVIGDTHGCYNELKELISILEENNEYRRGIDKLVFLGDYIDRGSNSKLVIEFIRNLQENNNNVIALMGNHEDMLINYLDGTNEDWLWNGHRATIDSYGGYTEQFHNDVQWIRNLPLYHEDDNYIYVHAGIDPKKSMKKQKRHTLLWVRNEFIYNEKKYHKKVIFGHTPTANLGEGDKPVRTFSGNIDIDTACVYGGALTALIIENGEVDGFYQVEKNYEEVNI